MRLDACILSHLTSLIPPPVSYDSKRKKRALRLIREGHVRVDDVTIIDPKVQVVPKVSDVTCEGATVIKHHDHRLYKFYKPPGLISQRHPTDLNIYDMVPAAIKKDLTAWGRLDKDTTGVMVWGTDGGVAHLVLRPPTGAELSAALSDKTKTYVATLEESTSLLDEAKIAELSRGAVLVGTANHAGEEGTEERIACLSASLTILDDKRVELVISEGFYHQVKRMIAHCGGLVVGLHRAEFSGVVLDDDMEEGEFRELSVEEIRLLVPSGLLRGYEIGDAKEIEERRKRGVRRVEL